ncbi:MAG: hypothetical protein RJQ00_12245 [Vicingaceae bacterium]
MKSNMIKVSYMLAIAVVFSTACEKEDIQTNDKTTLNNSFEKVKKDKLPNNKSGFPSGYWDDLQLFISDVMNNNALSDMDAEKAFYYTESALDFRLSGREDALKRRVNGEELSFNVDLEAVGSSDILAEDLESLNDDIYDEIDTEASDLASSLSETITAENIDLTWDIDVSSGTAIVYANVLYGIFGAGIGCVTLQDAKAGVAERCSGAAYNHAADEVDKKTAPLCEYWADELTCTAQYSIIYNITNTTIQGLSTCGSFVFSGNESTCRSAADNESDFQSARSAWNNSCGSFRFDKLKTVRYRKTTSNSFGNMGHTASYYTALCKSLCGQIPQCPAISRPEPQWQ